jgi:hypothetical protein
MGMKVMSPAQTWSGPATLNARSSVLGATGRACAESVVVAEAAPDLPPQPFLAHQALHARLPSVHVVLLEFGVHAQAAVRAAAGGVDREDPAA